MHRKDLTQMLITIAVIVAAFLVIQQVFFPAVPPPPPQPPAANQPPAEIRDTTPTARTDPPATAPEGQRGFAPIDRAAARTFNLRNERLNATISERGAVLERLSFFDRSGNPVQRTPNDPTRAPTELLELITPLESGQHAAPLALRLDENDAQRNVSRWEHVRGPETVQDGVIELEFRFPPAGFGRESDETVIYKTFQVLPDTYRIDVKVRVENHGERLADKNVGLWGAAAITNDGIRDGADHNRVALYGSTASKRYTDLFDSPGVGRIADEIASYNRDRAEQGLPAVETMDNRTLDDVTNPDRFLIAHGLRTQYFIAFLAADPAVRDARWSGEVYALPNTREAATSLLAPPLQIPAGKSQEVRMTFYAGPRDKAELEYAWVKRAPIDDELLIEWKELAPTGWPAIISAPMIWVLRKLTDGVGAGFAIILLTLIVRIALSPLSYRGQKSMAIYTQKMKVVKPKLDKIKEKYAGKKDRDSQLKMLTETREAMKAQNVGMFPLGGCLPMLIQLPIFIGLYRAFGSAFFLRQAEFLWIKDLSLPDATIPVSFQADMFLLNFLAHNGFLTLNLLPVLWIVLSLIQMKMQPKPDDPQQAAMQKQMGCIFPLMGLFFYSFASGFAFYFIVSSLFSIGESKLIKRNLIRQGVMPTPSKNPPKEGDKPKYAAS